MTRFREGGEYIAFVDDPMQELEGYRYSIEAGDEEEARLNAQEAFPYGVIRSVHHAEELRELEEASVRAKEKREFERARDAGI